MAVVGPYCPTQVVAEAKDRIRLLNQEIERRLDGASFAAGDCFSVADPFVLVFFRWANVVGLDAANGHPQWAAWAGRMEARPAVARVLAREGLSVWPGSG